MVELVGHIHLEVDHIRAVLRIVVDLPAGKHPGDMKGFALGSRRWMPCCCDYLVKAIGMTCTEMEIKELRW